MTDAGAYTLSVGPYGTFDQGGNVWEWNETLFGSPFRGIRGGHWSIDSDLHAAYWTVLTPSVEDPGVGFRVAMTSIPEPSTILLVASALGAMLCRWLT